MNQLLFNRSTGNLSPQAFARLQTSQLISAIEPAPKLCFNGGEKGIDSPDEEVQPHASRTAEVKIWAQIGRAHV